MTKTEARKAAKEFLLRAISNAYGALYDDHDYSAEEKDIINEYMDKYEITMAKSIGEEPRG